MNIDNRHGHSSDLAGMDVPQAGRLVATADPLEPYRLLDPAGRVAEGVAAFFRDLQAAGRSPATLRSYGLDLLRWFRFLWAAGVVWDRATRTEARDFCRWLLVAGKPARPHWRKQGGTTTTIRAASAASPSAGEPYAASVRAHSETVLRSFYDFHRDAGTGPIINPFPLDRSRRGGRPHAHHNPMEPHGNEHRGLYRPRVPSRIPRCVPDSEFNEIFARLPSHRDRALAYHAVHRMFERVNQQAGTSATLHALRHTAAYRMAEDPALPLTDVQFVLGHARLTSTQAYLTPRKEDVIRRILAHYAQQTRQAAERARPALAPGYRPETLDVLFRNGVS